MVRLIVGLILLVLGLALIGCGVGFCWRRLAFWRSGRGKPPPPPLNFPP